jgi:hypothetical protein
MWMKYAAELMAETESVADDDLPSTSLRKGPASETAESIPEPAIAERTLKLKFDRAPPAQIGHARIMAEIPRN